MPAPAASRSCGALAPARHREVRREALLPRAAAVALALGVLAGAARADVAGSVVSLAGTVVARTPGGAQRLIASKSDVMEGELLATAADSFARVRFRDGTEISLRPNTQMRIEAYRYDGAKPAEDNVFLNLLKGGLRAITGAIAKRNPNAYRMDAVTATIGIRGTHYGALICQDDCAGLTRPDGSPLQNGLHMDVEEGCIAATNEVGRQAYCRGQFAYVPSKVQLPEFIPPNLGIRIPVLEQTRPFGPPIPGEPGAPQECVI
jgi:hypothetical protein